ncbi:MAG: GNAT family N-acetyltransferase [Clostridia bacterium]
MDIREGLLSTLLPDMEAVASRQWTRMSYRHVGNLAWARCTIPDEDDPPAAIWTDGDDVVAAAWIEEGNTLQWICLDDSVGLGPVLNWFIDRKPTDGVYAVLLDTERTAQSILARHGFQPVADGPYFAHMWRALGDLPAMGSLPSGFRARAMRGPQDVDARVAIHRAAWHPSGMTATRYHTLMADRAYRPEFDWVIEAPDGSFAASALLWVDFTHGAGLLEPVGTDPQYRRQGLSRAVCLAALHAFRVAGGTEVIVQPRGDAAYPIPYQLYRGMGFEPIARTITYRRGV